MRRRARSRAALVCALALPVLGACSGSGDDAATAVPAASEPAATDPSGGPVVAQPEGSPPATTAAPMPSAPPPETGIPGLDSADAFCAAWSRYAGSYQMVAVASFFLSEQPDRVFALEVAAANVVSAAYADMSAHWPAELADERSAALEQTFGPFAARAATAAQLLADAGADPAAVEAISAAWFDALATRNPDDPDVTLQLDTRSSDLLDAAAAALAAARPPVPEDASLVISAVTPLTDAYLAVNCPDQGQLAGNDVTG